jgi:hypothetical protein
MNTKTRRSTRLINLDLPYSGYRATIALGVIAGVIANVAFLLGVKWS